MTRIPSGVTNKGAYFVALDATDFTTRETGLASFTVVRSRNGGADATYTTPTITEIDAVTMPGVYFLLLDEDTTIDSGDDEQEIALHITHAGMAPVTLVVELFRPKITVGNTLDVSADGDGEANLTKIGGDAQSATDLKDFADAGYDPATNKVEGVKLADTLTTYTGNTPQTGDSFARLGAPAGASVSADVAGVKSDSAAILADTGTDGVVVAAASKTGYALSSAGVQAIWDALTSALTTAGSIGKHIVDNINVPISTRATPAQVATEFTTAGVTAAVMARLDVAVSTRLAAAGYTAPDNASIAAIQAAVITEVADILTAVTSILADTNELQGDWVDGGRLDLLIDAIKAKTDPLPASPAAVGSSMVLSAAERAAIMTTALVESYAANGAAPTPAQALLMLLSRLNEFAIVGTTMTTNRLDGVTPAMTFTLDDAATPTAISRTS